MQIVVLDGATLNPGDISWDPIAQLGDLTVYPRTPGELIVERAQNADIVLTNKTLLSKNTLLQLPQLKLIGVLATGYNVVDVAAAKERGVLVCNVPEYGSQAVAQYTFALILALCHRVEHHAQRVHDGQWTRVPDFCFWETPQVELAGRTLGIVGTGRIGRRVGALGRAFGMNVIAHSRTMTDAPFYKEFSWGSIDEVFTTADVVTLHCPQSADNIAFVNAALLARMKPSAFLINTARGLLVHEHDLARALQQGIIAGAALDVVAREPMDPNNPLLGAPNCLITPHMAWGARAVRERLMAIMAANIAGFLQGQPRNLV